MKFSSGTDIHNSVPVPQKGFLTAKSFRIVICYGICVAFLALPMEVIMDSVLTGVHIEVLPYEWILSELCGLVVHIYLLLFVHIVLF
jgi:hypothetical protein